MDAFSGSTSPTTTEVSTWLDDAEAEVTQYLEGAGIPTSGLSSNAQTVLKRFVVSYAEARVRMAWASSQGDGDNDDGGVSMLVFTDFLDDIIARPAQWGETLTGGSAPAGTIRIRSNTIAVVSSTTAAGDKPAFTRAEVF
jgi:hypothetical protein